jgi:hypothetical protein
VEIPNGRSTRSWWCSCSNEIFIEARIIAWRLFNSDWKNIAENLAIVPDLNDGQEVIHEIQKSIKSHRKYSNFIRKRGRLCCQN